MSFKTTWQEIKAKLLTIFGDIKLIPFPLFAYYQPGDYYKATGAETRQALNTIQAGDVIVRGYDSYLDGYFIPGEFSHTGIVLSKTNMAHAIAEGVCEIDPVDFLRCDRFVVLRPNSGKTKAINRVKAWLGKPYDFEFADGIDAFYCHELVAEAYAELNIEKITPYWGRFKFIGMQPRYLAESFINNENFTILMAGGNSSVQPKTTEEEEEA